jgi:hypothetical protein
VNDRYTQIELPEKREAIRRLEAWLESQTRLLEAAEDQQLLLQAPTQNTNATEEHPNERNETQPPVA